MENNKITRPTIIATKRAKTYNLDKACEFIAQDFPMRSSSEELKKLLEQKGIDEDSLKKKLGRKNEAIVGKWLHGELKDGKIKQVKIGRESAIKILLELNTTISDISKRILIMDAENFIMHSCWEDGFYERDYKDVIYMFCLRNSLGFDEAENLKEQYRSLDKDNAEVSNINGIKNRLTVFLGNESIHLKTTEDLDEFFTEYKDYFGNFNRTAYNEFRYYYDQVTLKLNSDKIEDIEYFKSKGEEKKYTHNYATIKEICDAFPNKGKAPAIDLIQKMISADDLKEKRLGLNGVLGKKENVPRKYLMLFFLMNRGDTGSYKSSIRDLNKLLDKCGMPFLDSRNPFDWVVMNAFYASAKGNTDVIERMKKIYEKIFTIESEGNE